MSDLSRYDDLDDDDTAPLLIDDPTLPVTLTDALIPLKRDGHYVPNHQDADGTVHFFARAEAPDQTGASDPAHELRYYRASQDADGQLVHDSHPVMPMERADRSPFPLPQLELMLEDGDLENVQELAYHTAQAYGMTFPDPDTLPPLIPDRDQALADFIREHGDEDTQPLEPVQAEPDPAVETFREAFADSAHKLLEPVDPTVNYSFAVTAADPHTLELTADKWWLEDNGRVGHDEQVLKTYPLEAFEIEQEIDREAAAMERAELHRTYRVDGLEAALREAEQIAVENGELDPEREDGRLFSDGPPDRFTTLREAELAGLDASVAELRAVDITGEDTQSLPSITPESEIDDGLEAARHYWQMHYRPAETPDGEPLGTALFVTEFPELPPNFDAIIDADGLDDSIYPTEARTLEMAHFASEDAARKFDAEFRSHLIPGLLEGPDLAPEVAKLEGLSGEWEDMDYRGIADYMGGKRTIIREAGDWHLHNRYAERDTRVEGLYTDPIHQYTTFDEDDPKVEPAAPDFDL